MGPVANKKFQASLGYLKVLLFSAHCSSLSSQILQMAGKVSATQISFRVLLLSNSLVPALPMSEEVFPDRKQKSKNRTVGRGERGKRKRGREQTTGTRELG